MSEEHGYQRSGKKCREKFENLYKYYKKTKEGKAGRQDGKHYRFFRQLEALYGENSNNTASLPETNFGGTTVRFQTSNNHTLSQTNQDMFHSHQKHCDSLSLTNSTDFDSTSSEDNDDHSNVGLKDNDSMEKRRKRRSWKVKIKDFIDSQMRKLVEKQEEWLEKLTNTLEQKEKERVLREEEWRRQEGERLETEHKFWAKERAWIEARDAALMEALQKLTGNEVVIKTQSHHEGIMGTGIIQNQNNEDAESWPESEITRLGQLKTEMEARIRESGCPEEVMWEEIATKMACFGYERTPLMFKEKWESMSNCARNIAKDIGYKKRKENSRSCFYFDNNNDHQSSLYNQGGAFCDVNDQRQGTGRLQTNDGSSPSNSNVGNVVGAESCFPFLMSEGGNLWENYSLKMNKANQN